MGFLTTLIGKLGGEPAPADPTLEWPEWREVALSVVPHEGRLNDMPFGAAVEAARFLGRPSRVRWLPDGYLELLYAEAGLEVGFKAGRFENLVLMMDRHVAEPDIPFHFARINVRLANGHACELSRESNRGVVEGCFGRAARVDVDVDETILFYTLGGIEMEFEMHPKTATLMRLNLFPPGE
jgi:hypothetical protein